MKLNNALLVILFIFIGCKDKSVDSSNGPKQIFPLAFGNTWKMLDEPEGFTITTGSVAATAPHDNTMMYCFSGNDHIFFESSGATQFLFYKGNDLWQSRDGKDNLLIPFNRVVGDSTIRADSLRVAKIISLNDTVIVPAGTFVCTKIAYTQINSTLIRYYWLADGVGVVEILYAGYNRYWALQSYSLN